MAWPKHFARQLTFIGRIIGQLKLCLHILSACLEHVERDQWLRLFRAAKVCNHLDHLTFVYVQHKLFILILEYACNADSLRCKGNLQLCAIDLDSYECY